MSLIKGLLPSLREKKRYLVIELISERQIKDFSGVSDAIWQNSLQMLGELGVAEAGINILKDKWNHELQRAIIRVNHKHVDTLKTSLTFLRKIKGQDVIVKSVGVSGILKKACKKYMSS